MANIGDKYIIEIKDLGVQRGNYYLKNSVFDHVVISDEALQGYEKYDPEADYQRGLNDAWEAARKVYLPENQGGLSSFELDYVFGIGGVGMLFTEFNAKEVIEKLYAYEAKKEAEKGIKVGDEVIQSFTHSEGVVVELPLEGDIVTVLEKTGHAFGTPKSNLKKTGRHFPQVEELLDAMKEDGETNA